MTRDDKDGEGVLQSIIVNNVHAVEEREESY